MNMIKRALIAGGLVGTLAVAAAAPSSAQIIVEQYGFYGPYGGYAYAPRYRGYWDYPAGYDTGGAPYFYRDLGWQPGVPGAAPANPCWPGQRGQNRC